MQKTLENLSCVPEVMLALSGLRDFLLLEKRVNLNSTYSESSRKVSQSYSSEQHFPSKYPSVVLMCLGHFNGPLSLKTSIVQVEHMQGQIVSWHKSALLCCRQGTCPDLYQLRIWPWNK